MHAYKSFSLKDDWVLKLGSLSVLKHVEAVGRRSASLARPTLAKTEVLQSTFWMVKGGLRALKPKRGELEDEVTKRRTPLRSSAESFVNTVQNSLIVEEEAVYLKEREARQQDNR